MILPFRTVADADAALPAVREHLARGALLAYPTETVYGLGSAPREEPLEALARLKGRPAGKPFLLLVAGRPMAEAWGLVFPPAAAALAREFWPGPLTLVLPGGEGKLPDRLRGPEGGIAVRHTSHPLVARLADGLGHPITSTSANEPGQPPAPGAEALAETFADAIAAGELLVLDGGPLGNVPASTIVDCTAPVPRLVREGAIPRTELRRRVGEVRPVTRVLLVCTGNTCRSPLAEAILRREVQERGVDGVVVESAGSGAWEGVPASEGSYLVGLENGLDLSGHRARLLTRELVEQADLILTMGRSQLARAEALGGAGKTWLLGEFAGRSGQSAEVRDPFGGGIEQYREAYRELAVLAQVAAERIAEGQRAP